MKIRIEHPSGEKSASVHSNKVGIEVVVNEICNLLIAYGYTKQEVKRAIAAKHNEYLLD